MSMSFRYTIFLLDSDDVRYLFLLILLITSRSVQYAEYGISVWKQSFSVETFVKPTLDDYLQLYCFRHVVKDHTYSKLANNQTQLQGKQIIVRSKTDTFRKYLVRSTALRTR
ncbi:unnamed protein product [Amoebophrya sp. A25]|nr:unnamed protein product [Amoebophrya sp. A25]|eukprot:GSA25T00005687001.1